jgi:hypothetical protein
LALDELRPSVSVPYENALLKSGSLGGPGSSSQRDVYSASLRVGSPWRRHACSPSG